MARWWTMAFAALALVLVSSCGPCGEKASEQIAEGVIEKAIETGSGGEVDVEISEDQEHMKITAGEGSMEIGEKVEVPKDFPKDIPLYPGATAKMAMSRDEAGQIVSLQSKDKMEKIAEFYKTKMTEGGWESVGEMTMPNYRMFNYKKSDRNAQIILTAEPEATAINISHSQAKSEG